MASLNLDLYRVKVVDCEFTAQVFHLGPISLSLSSSFVMRCVVTM
jgi:hypothetical protein